MDAMRLYLAILLAIDNNLVILRRTCIRLGHEPGSFRIFVLGGGQNISKMTRVRGVFLLAKKGKQCSAGIFV